MERDKGVTVRRVVRTEESTERRISREPPEVWTWHTGSLLRVDEFPRDMLWVITLQDGRLAVESNMTRHATRAVLRRLADDLDSD